MPTDSTSRTILLLAAAAVTAWLAWLLQSTLAPFLLAFALAYLLNPLLDRLEAAGLHRAVAVALVFTGFLVAFFGALVAIVPRVAEQFAELAARLDFYSMQLVEGADAWVRRNEALLARFNLPPTSRELWQQYGGQLGAYVQAALGAALGALQASAGALSWIVVVPIVTLYLLADMDRMRARWLHLVPSAYRDRTEVLASRVGGVFAAYLRGLTALCAAYALAVYLVLTLFQLPYALVLGLAAAVCYSVPYLGQILLILTAAAVAWVTGRGFPLTLGVGFALLLVGQLFDQLITPRVIGRQVGIHPVLALFALMVGGQLFGLPGMVVAVPVAGSLRLLLGALYPPLTEPLPPSTARSRPDPRPNGDPPS